MHEKLYQEWHIKISPMNLHTHTVDNIRSVENPIDVVKTRKPASNHTHEDKTLQLMLATTKNLFSYADGYLDSRTWHYQPARNPYHLPTILGKEAQ